MKYLLVAIALVMGGIPAAAQETQNQVDNRRMRERWAQDSIIRAERAAETVRMRIVPPAQARTVYAACKKLVLNQIVFDPDLLSGAIITQPTVVFPVQMPPVGDQGEGSSHDYLLESYVNAQNRFGAPVRHDYICYTFRDSRGERLAVRFLNYNRRKAICSAGTHLLDLL